MTHEFDITADISRQRSGEEKVLWIADTGLDRNHPIIAILEISGICVFAKNGLTGMTHSNDLHTLPEPLPLIVSYHNVYPFTIVPIHASISTALGAGSDQLAVIETTFDPNTGIASAKTVWRKGE